MLEIFLLTMSAITAFALGIRYHSYQLNNYGNASLFSFFSKEQVQRHCSKVCPFAIMGWLTNDQTPILSLQKKLNCFWDLKLKFPLEGETSCLDGEAHTPVSVTMSSIKRSRFGPKNCADGDPATRCQTKKEQFPTITLDFGKVVNIATVSSFSCMLIPNR